VGGSGPKTHGQRISADAESGLDELDSLSLALGREPAPLVFAGGCTLMKLPAFQFYPGDWRKDPGIQSLTLEQRGAWLEIMCLMHEAKPRGYLVLNGKPFPEDSLGRLLGFREVDLLNQNQTTGISHLLTLLVERGVASKDQETGAIYCRRMVRDEEIRKTRAECGKLGGNPLLVKQNSTKSANGGQQKPTPSSSVSVSSSEDTMGLPMGAAVSAEQVYEEFPNKVARPKAIEAINRAAQKACQKAKEAGFSDCMAYLLDRTLAFSAATAKWQESERTYIPHPTTWFNQERFNDDPKTWERRPAHNGAAKPDRINFKTDDYANLPT
jgi:hypothetical protein